MMLQDRADLRPIMLFGMPRSGTTWLGKVFDSHPQTLYRHEPDSGGTLDPAMPLFPDPERAEDYSPAVASFVATLPAERSLRVTGKLPVFPKAYRSAHANLAHRCMVMGAKFGSRWLPVREVPAMIPTGYSGPLRLVWKSIESLGRLGVLARALPDAKAIHIVRHPCGYVASVLSGEARGMLPGAVSASEDYGIFELLLSTPQARRRGLTLSALRELRPEERLAWRWLLFNEKAIEELSSAPNAMTVRYEDLCQDPLTGYQKLFAFADLSWDSQTAAFVDQSTSSERSAYFSVFKDPQRAATGWKQKLTDEQKQSIIDVAFSGSLGQLYNDFA